ncbi:MAG TPA: recombination protein RecR, partial [Thermoguttaceae bacterium]|nr:recombination protein RecR [Thermoguttaceae bacterium]HPP51803.1 recombination protein RecR [Thermoguttaceae bacterium]
TALYISQQLAPFSVRITRLARGITAGSVLEFANKEILTDALSGRQEFS